jgi:hypothetical protein
MDIAHRALERYDALPLWLRWKKPRNAQGDEVTLLTWAEELEAPNQRAIARIKHEEGVPE